MKPKNKKSNLNVTGEEKTQAEGRFFILGGGGGGSSWSAFLKWGTKCQLREDQRFKMTGQFANGFLSQLCLLCVLLEQLAHKEFWSWASLLLKLQSFKNPRTAAREINAKLAWSLMTQGSGSGHQSSIGLNNGYRELYWFVIHKVIFIKLGWLYKEKSSKSWWPHWKLQMF